MGLSYLASFGLQRAVPDGLSELDSCFVFVAFLLYQHVKGQKAQTIFVMVLWRGSGCLKDILACMKTVYYIDRRKQTRPTSISSWLPCVLPAWSTVDSIKSLVGLVVCKGLLFLDV